MQWRFGLDRAQDLSASRHQRLWRASAITAARYCRVGLLTVVTVTAVRSVSYRLACSCPGSTIRSHNALPPARLVWWVYLMVPE